MEYQAQFFGQPTPWNKGKLVGQKAPLRVSEIWAIRVRLESYRRVRDLALFNLAIDSKLRGCDLVQLRVNDVSRKSLGEWIAAAGLRHGDFLFPSRISESPHISTRQYARMVHQWFDEIGLDPTAYSTHTMRRTKPTLIYRRTKNLRAMQLLLDHTRLESTVRYLGIEVGDALEMAEQTDA
jgi:integrase